MRFLQKFYSIKNKYNIVIVLLIILVIFSVVLSFCFGAANISLIDLIDIIFEHGSNTANKVFYHVRLPRTIATVFAGASLAVSGFLIQSVLDNPLAGPSIIGVNSGAGFAVVVFYVFFPHLIRLVPVVAFLGAFSTTLLIFFIGQKIRASRITIILSGIAISSILNAGIDTVITLIPDVLIASNTFKIGGVQGITIKKLFPQVWIILITLIVVYLIAADLDILLLGEETAQSLGLKVNFYRFLVLVLAALLSGLAVSFSGLLGFIGLVIPHIARKFINNKSNYMVLFCIFAGASFLTLCDLISRTLFNPFEVPVGLVLSIVGGLFFLWLLTKQKRRHSYDNS